MTQHGKAHAFPSFFLWGAAFEFRSTRHDSSGTALFLFVFSGIVLIDLPPGRPTTPWFIAMAVERSEGQRGKGIIYGSLAAVLASGLADLFCRADAPVGSSSSSAASLSSGIAVKLFVKMKKQVEIHKEAVTLLARHQADRDRRYITMALDNMLAVGAASNGEFFFSLLGLGLSSLHCVYQQSDYGSWVDTGHHLHRRRLLGKIGGQMIITDPIISRFITAAP